MELNAIKYMERAARTNKAIVSLGQGIPSSHLDAALQQVAIETIRRGDADAYSDPQGLPRLRYLIAGQLIEQDMNYSADEIIITAGAIEALSVVLRSVVSSDTSEVIVPTPVYGAYFKLIETARGKAVQIPLDEEASWALDIELLARSVNKNTAAILLCNPNNPTGSVYDKATLEAVAIIAKKAGIALIVDEVYRNMLFSDERLYSPAQDPQFKQTVIRLMSFSKDFAMTGWRVGYIQADRSRITKLLAIHDTLVNCAPVISQYVACEAVLQQVRIIEENRVMYDLRRRLMASYLDKLSGHMSYEMPRGGYFFFPKYLGGPKSDLLAQQLLACNLAVIPGSAFGLGGEGHLRLCFGRSEAAIREGMERLVQYYHAK
jgi:aminotransferase